MGNDDMRYATPELIQLQLDRLMRRTMPGFTLHHYWATPHHDHLAVSVCAKEGLNTVKMEARVWPTFAMWHRFDYLGIAPDCHHPTGMDERVRMLIEVHPDAHIQHIDDEGYDDDDDIFGYVAYDDDLKVLAWAPIPVDGEGMAMPEAAAYITHTIPAGVEYPMQSIREHVLCDRGNLRYN